MSFQQAEYQTNVPYRGPQYQSAQAHSMPYPFTEQKLPSIFVSPQAQLLLQQHPDYFYGVQHVTQQRTLAWPPFLAQGPYPVLPYQCQQPPVHGYTHQSVLPHTTPTYGSASPVAAGENVEKPQSIDYLLLVSFTILPSLKHRHRSKAVSGVRGQNYPCQHCSKVFQKPYNLKLHMKTHLGEKPFKCSVCPKTFARSHDKRRHETLHGGEKNFKCEGYLKDGTTKWGCGKKFARSDALSRHFRTEAGWMCIKLLMDEAKHDDQRESLGYGGHPDEDDSGSYDNSSVACKLVQSK